MLLVLQGNQSISPAWGPLRLWCLCWEQAFRVSSPVQTTLKCFLLPLQKNPAQTAPKPLTLGFFQLGILTLLNYSDDFYHRKAKMTRAFSCWVQITHRGEPCPELCRLRVPVSHSCRLSALPHYMQAPHNPLMAWDAAQTGRYLPAVKSAEVFVMTETTLLVI